MTRPSGDDLVALADAGVKRAKAKGADEVEVYATYQSRASVEFRGRLGDVQETGEGGVCVRVAIGRRTGFAGSPGLTDESVDRAIERALANARGGVEDPRFRHYADPQPASAPPTRIDARVADPDADRILGDAKTAAAGVAGRDDVTYISFQLAASCVTFGVANGRGVASWDQDARESFLCELRVSEGALHKTANEFGVERAPLSERLDLGALVANAATRAQQALRTQPIEGTIDAVVLDFVPASLILSPFLDNLQVASSKKDSALGEKLGQRIASPSVTLRDSPHRALGSRSQRIDDEGVPTRTTTLLENGVLKDLITSAYVAHQKGQPSSGNGYRVFDNRWTGTPKPRFASVDLEPGAKSLDDILAGVDRAVYVRDYLLGWFTNNPVTGDFSTVAPLAYLVEKGTIVQALPPTTVAGNVFRMLENVEEVSRERRTLQRGTFPALRVSGLTCAT